VGALGFLATLYLLVLIGVRIVSVKHEKSILLHVFKAY